MKTDTSMEKALRHRGRTPAVGEVTVASAPKPQLQQACPFAAALQAGIFNSASTHDTEVEIIRHLVFFVIQNVREGSAPVRQTQEA